MKTKVNIWYFIVGVILSGIGGYVMSDLQAWEYVVGVMCILVGFVFIDRSRVVAVTHLFNKEK